MNAIPAMAAYESWKPTDVTDSGEMTSCMNKAARSMLPVL